MYHVNKQTDISINEIIFEIEMTNDCHDSIFTSDCWCLYASHARKCMKCVEHLYKYFETHFNFAIYKK